jgi:hypothetical protein
VRISVEVPDELLGRARAEASVRGVKLRELIVQGLQWRLEQRNDAEGGAAVPESLPLATAGLPVHRGADGAPGFELGPERIHELELQSELNRHAIPVR